MYILQFIGVMMSMFLADICWAYYFIKVDERRSVSAGFWAIALFVCGATVTSNYVDDKSLIIARSEEHTSELQSH